MGRRWRVSSDRTPGARIPARGNGAVLPRQALHPVYGGCIGRTETCSHTHFVWQALLRLQSLLLTASQSKHCNRLPSRRRAAAHWLTSCRLPHTCWIARRWNNPPRQILPTCSVKSRASTHWPSTVLAVPAPPSTCSASALPAARTP